jgi:hypothetical protein
MNLSPFDIRPVFALTFGGRQFGKHRFEHRRHASKLPGPNHDVPHALELFPSGGVEEMLRLVLDSAVRERGPGNR